MSKPILATRCFVPKKAYIVSRQRGHRTRVDHVTPALRFTAQSCPSALHTMQSPTVSVAKFLRPERLSWESCECKDTTDRSVVFRRSRVNCYNRYMIQPCKFVFGLLKGGQACNSSPLLHSSLSHLKEFSSTALGL